MNRALRIGLVIGACLIAALVFGVFGIAYLLQLPMHVKRDIARDVSVSNEWTEVKASSPMRIERNFQSVDLVIDGTYMTSAKGDHNLYLSDGAVIDPEVQIADLEGTWYALKGGRYAAQFRLDGSEIMDVYSAGFEPPGGELPKDRTYTSIRIRSDVPFTCKKVIWQNYNLK